VLHLDADDPMLYDLVINTGVLSLDRAVDLIQLALEDKPKRSRCHQRRWDRHEGWLAIQANLLTSAHQHA